MSTLEILKKCLLTDEFDPFDMSPLESPPSFHTEDIPDDFLAPTDPFAGFRESMDLLGNDLKRGIEIHCPQSR